MTISLDGLLDYDEEDRDEATFELSVVAESFHEMLSREMGTVRVGDKDKDKDKDEDKHSL